jgi:hypothetical protein
MTHHLPLPPPYSQSLKPSPHPILLIIPITRKACTLNMNGSSPLSSILKNSSPEQYYNIIDHHHYTSSTTQTSNQTETKHLSSLKILTLNVRGVFTSQHDPRYYGPYRNKVANRKQPPALVTSTTHTNKNGGTIVCVRKSIALATDCSLVHSDPEGRHQKHKPPALRCKHK